MKKFKGLLAALAFVPALYSQSGPEIEVLTPDVCVPGKVTVKVINCPTCVAWDWEIGSGTGFKSGPDEYSTIVNSAGWFDVSVKIRTSSGAKSLVSKKNAFFGRESPKPVFGSNKTGFCYGADTLVLTDSTKNIISRDWLIDGVVFYNAAKTMKLAVGTKAGYRSVYVLVRDSWGCKGTLLKDSMFAVWPAVKATANPTVTKGCAPKYISFNPVIDSLGQNLKKVKWTFQGGSPDTVLKRNPGLIYYAKGDTFDVFIDIETIQGCKYSFKENNLISLGDTAVMTITVPKTKICVNEPILISVKDHNIPRVIWSFTGVSASADSFIGTPLKVKFTDTGNAYVTVTNANRGCVSTAKYNSPIKVEGPKAVFYAEDPFYCAVPKTLSFTNRSSPFPGGTSYYWSIYNSSNTWLSSGTNTDFSYYTTTGLDYRVKLLAVGANGCRDSLDLIKASVFGHMDTTFKIRPNPVCPGVKVFAVPTAGSGPVKNRNKYQWTFYNLNGSVYSTDTKDSGEVRYFNAGSYAVKMVISNANNCKDSQLLKDTIHVILPTVNIAAKDTFVCKGQTFVAYIVNKNAGKKLSGFWRITSIDSILAPYDGVGDTFRFVPIKTGRYRLVYTVVDTVNKCTNEVVLPNYLKVSGSNYIISADVNFGCAPLKVNLTAKQVENVNYNGKSGVNSFMWISYFPKQVFFADSSAQNTQATALRGEHNIRFKYKNPSGCVDSTNLLHLSSGMNLGFMTQSPVCKNTQQKFYYSGSSWVTGYEYSCDSSAINFVPNKNDKDPVVAFSKAGLYKFRLIGSYKTCKDTVFNTVLVNEAKADFYTPDSVSFCAPKLINFINTTPNAIYNKWKFGDGDSTLTAFNQIAGHLYKQNNKIGYTVTLYTVNNYGCKDTMVKKNYVRIIGPVPDFEILTKIGCEPLLVKFLNKSKDFNRMFVDYDNGIVLDSVVFSNYVYRVTDKSLSIQAFKPRLLLYDSFGCSALAYAKDSILIKKNAEAKFSYTSANFLRKTEGCANDLLVKFTNQSKFAVRNYWDFNNDWLIDISNQNSPSYYYDKPGVFFPLIIAENVNGCRDTFKQDSIVVWEPPVAKIWSSADTTCAIDPVNFKSVSTFKYPIVSQSWNFGEAELYIDTSSKIAPTWKYTAPFNHPVTLDVVDIKGCKSATLKDIYVNDTAGPLAPAVAYITVKNNNTVEYFWRYSKLGNYLMYHTFLDSIKMYHRYQSFKRSDTSYAAYYGNLVNTRRFCMTTSIEDTCNQQGHVATSHCTIVLRDSIKEPYHIDLIWLAYDFWNTDLDHYEIFRKDPGTSIFKKIADIKSNKLIYTDSFLCEGKYCYYVEAVHKNRIYRSRSNEICDAPIYIKPDGVVNTKLVTVVNDAYTKILWEPYYKYYPRFSYVLERSSSGQSGSFYTTVVSKGLSHSDLAANVHDRVNYYRVSFRDHCGIDSRPGVISNSIWLQSVSQNRSSVSIIWNPYKYWYSGVKEYTLEIKDKFGTFQTFRTLNPNTFKVDSLDIEKLNLDSICFRVFAVKDSIGNDTSYSNELCLVPASYIYIPTAFSPDQNSLNEVFKPVFGFVHRNKQLKSEQYEFAVYNRWGQLVFYTNNPDEGWDGTYKGDPSPSGLYICQAKALGYDGVPHRVKGTVMLMR